MFLPLLIKLVIFDQRLSSEQVLVKEGFFLRPKPPTKKNHTGIKNQLNKLIGNGMMKTNNRFLTRKMSLHNLTSNKNGNKLTTVYTRV